MSRISLSDMIFIADSMMSDKKIIESMKYQSTLHTVDILEQLMPYEMDEWPELEEMIEAAKGMTHDDVPKYMQHFWNVFYVHGWNVGTTTAFFEKLELEEDLERLKKIFQQKENHVLF